MTHNDSALMNRWILLYCSLVGTKHECMTVLCCCISIWTTATCIMVVCCCVCLSLTLRVVLLVSRTVLKLQIHNIYPISPINDETFRILLHFYLLLLMKISGRSFHLFNKPAASSAAGGVHDCIRALKKAFAPPIFSHFVGGAGGYRKRFWIAQ